MHDAAPQSSPASEDSSSGSHRVVPLDNQVSANQVSANQVSANQVSANQVSASISQSWQAGWELSISQLMTYRWSLLEEVRALVAHRGPATSPAYRGSNEIGPFQLEVANHINSVGLWRPKLADFGEERAAELLREHQIKVGSLSWIGGFTGQNDCSCEEALFDASQAIEQAQCVGARTLIAMTGGRCGHITPHCRRLVIDTLKRLADLVSRTPLRVALQVMHKAFEKNWSFVNRYEDGLSLLDAVGCAQFGLALDSYQLQPDLAWLARWPELVARTEIIQVSDSRGRPGKPEDRCLPGDGKLPLVEFVSTAVKAGYRGTVELQVQSPEVWRADYRQVLNACTEFRQQVQTQLQSAVRPVENIAPSQTGLLRGGVHVA